MWAKPSSPVSHVKGSRARRKTPRQKPTRRPFVAPAPPQGQVQLSSPPTDEECTAASAQVPQASAAVGESNGNLHEASAVIIPYQRSWIERQLEVDPSRIARVCQFYQVGTLDELS